MTVLAVSPLRRRLVAVTLSDLPTPVEIDAEVWQLTGLAVGDEVSPAAWQRLAEESDRQRAYEKALSLLDYRAHSRRELGDKLRRLFPPPAVEQALEAVEALGLIDDEAYAADLAEEYARSRRYGAARVVNELLRRGIDRETARAAAEAACGDEAEETLLCLLRERYSPLPTDRRELAKVTAALVRRGYTYEQIRRALRQLAGEE